MQPRCPLISAGAATEHVHDGEQDHRAPMNETTEPDKLKSLLLIVPVAEHGAITKPARAGRR